MAAVAVFVSSSDNTADVFEAVFPSIKKFWPDCSFPIYAGFNEATPFGDFQPVRAQVAGWRKELRTQISLVNEDIILLLLDDQLLLAPVRTERLLQCLRIMTDHDLDYLCLLPPPDSYWVRALRWFGRQMGREGVLITLDPDRPYVSSLQIAFWKRSHLLAMLDLPGSIWDFENQFRPGSKHAAISTDPPFTYVHCVEKGRYGAVAPQLFRRAGLPFLPGNRPCEPAWRKYYGYYICLRFGLLGYAVVRFKRALRRITQ